MTIAFIHPFKSFLPEIAAYQYFFSRYAVIKTIVVHSKDAPQITADVKWYIMGNDFNKEKGTIKIHEYVSLSLPPFARFKNNIKTYFSAKPDFRIYQNEFIKKELHFNDAIPYGFRDMGISEKMIEAKKYNLTKKYDFIYVGSVDTGRNINRLLDHFTKPELAKFSLLVLSKNYDKMASKYHSYKNIVFKGPVPHNEVRHYISVSRFAINFFPTVFPHNMQTSTKFIEYAACKIPIITTEYEWVKSFQHKYGGNFFYVKNDLSDFDTNNIMSFNYAFPNISQWTWENQINKSGIVNFLKSKFSGFDTLK